MGLFNRIWSGIKSLAKLVLWPVTKLRGVHGIGQVLRWCLHLLFVCATVGLLWYLNNAWELDKALRVPFASLRTTWLPLLFLLTYGTAWCAWWLWRLVMAEDRPSEFPDIDAAWQEATASLSKAGVDLTKKPLFLVLGRPTESEAAFFSATQLPFTHSQVPRDPNAPLHVHASEEGIFVTCAGASLLGKQAAMLAADRVWKREEPLVSKSCCNERKGAKSAVDSAKLPPIHIQDQSTSEEQQVGSKAKDIKNKAAGQDSNEKQKASSATAVQEKPVKQETGNAAQQLSQGLGLVEQHLAQLAEDELTSPAGSADLLSVTKQESDQHDIPLVKDLGEIQALQDRLEHLCRLISSTREPYSPLNGVAVLIPYASSSSDRMANQVAELAQRDLNTVQETMQIRCPLVAIICDLHEAPGCREILQQFPEEQRHRRLGVRFPLMCNDPSANLTNMIDKGVRWVCRDLLPPLVYRLMRSTDAKGHENRCPGSTNVRLYSFLDDLRSREERLRRIMRQVFNPGKAATDPVADPRTWYPAGCYLVANGTDVARDQGFAGGVLPQLWQMQNLLAWTPAALKKDRKQYVVLIAGYSALALAIGLIALAFVRVL